MTNPTRYWGFLEVGVESKVERLRFKVPRCGLEVVDIPMGGIQTRRMGQGL